MTSFKSSPLGQTGIAAVRLLLACLLFIIGTSFRAVLPPFNRLSSVQTSYERTHRTPITRSTRSTLSSQTLPLHRNKKALLDTETPEIADIKDVKADKPLSLKDLLRQPPPPPGRRSGIVIIAGFESFNIQLYRKAAATIT